MGSFPHGGWGPSCGAAPLMCSDCSTKGESRKRSDFWTRQTAGKTKSSSEQASASRDRDGQLLVRMMSIIRPPPDKVAFCLMQPIRETGA